jgi:8-oxo-dGTP pyrophosphatase MutT (NUDIX family)
VKLPLSVLVVVHTAQSEVLLLERSARAGFWQSVTGSLERPDEPFEAAAARELGEETGLDPARGRLRRWSVAYTFEIYALWRHRFAPGVTHNTEHLFSFELPARSPVTLAPKEHTASTWLPWREAAARCFSWSNRDAILMIGAALLAAGCATREPPPAAAHLESGSPEVRDCAQWYRALDARIDAAGVRDAQYSRVPGFPHLRVDRLHAGLRERAAPSEAAWRAFGERLAELDLEARRHELRNLPELSAEAREQAMRRARDCSRQMRNADLSTPAARALLLRAAAVPDDPPAPRWQPEALRRLPPAVPNPVRYAPPPALHVPREVVGGMLGRAAFDPLAHPMLSEREVDRLVAAYAPSFEVEIAGEHDRFGRLRWRRAAAGGPPDVDSAQPTVYVQAAYTRYRQHVLLQLVYSIWFAEPFDGVVWRVTLAPDGEPLLYDSIQPCGRFHVFYPTPRATARDDALIPQSLPRIAEGERPVVTLAAGTHYIRAVSVARGGDSLVRYAVRAYDELRSLPRAGGEHGSIFAPDGRVPASGAGGAAMRQWGRQATSSAPPRHFDDADLLERRFELQL